MYNIETQETHSNELTTEELQYLQALKATDKAGSEAQVLFGILGGVVAAAFINPFVGGFVGIAIAGTSIVSGIGRASQRHKFLKGELPPLALLSGSQIQEYKEEVGEERFKEELSQISTKDSYGVLDKNLKEEIQTINVEAKASGVDPVQQLADYHSRHCLILGGSGDGKDMWLSNTVRHLVATEPNLRIFILDAKGLPREKGYYEGIGVEITRKACSECPDEEVIAWFKEQFEKFIELTQKDDKQWLFVSTEQTLIGEAFNRLKDNYLSEVVSKQTTTGSGFDRAFWFLAQFPNLQDLGMSNNSRGQLKTFAIAQHSNINNVCNQWKRYGIVGKPKADDLKRLCKISEVDRCFFSPDTGEWHPMLKLNNYSSYDRDSRKRIESSSDQETIKDSYVADDLDSKKLALIDGLMKFPLNDISMALIERNPLIKKDKLLKVVAELKEVAIKHDKKEFLQKFFGI